MISFQTSELKKKLSEMLKLSNLADHSYKVECSAEKHKALDKNYPKSDALASNLKEKIYAFSVIITFRILTLFVFQY